MSRAELTEADVPVNKEPAAAIELIDVRAGYGRVEVLHGVSLAVERGTVFALLGPNGAGKTTLLNTAAGFVHPTAGCVHVAGFHVNDVAPDVLAKAGVASISEGRGVFPNLSVSENLRVFTHAGNEPYGDVKDRAFARFPQLGKRRNQLAGTLSGGERQMLAMCRAFATEPAVLLIDEISMGLAPMIVHGLYEVVAQLAAEGLTILVVEQFAPVVLSVADAAAVMRLGNIVAKGKPDEVAGSLSEAYLGAAS
ncbi:MAG: ABC transporter ATP-binding protein [Acidimicrobiia bacterium]|nr:ABC transporter ATP-binding protein [Acidimicrobiia bacterium]